ncbi:NAD(P)/FAD-dependent oxidoreductase [Pontibaca salina]|uniref:NAD(P)/FAD-dependent oxidoreductase n=1 Tax=Pontibaca salina TaxID=2795731 RepID=A0A934HU64_9RHOB|nr:NAD(P)/FAD-dependent oxidoreductase [Pontibaca salina]
MKHIVVVGAGQAGSSLVFKLRALGHTGKITLIGEEADLPYQRPPLSKSYLLGEMARERLYLRPQASYDQNNITLCLGQRVTAVDPTTQTVQLKQTSLKYDELVFTTGSRPARLPAAMGGDLRRVYYVRTLADIDAMSAEFLTGRKVLIVGGGYIGLEAAAVAARKGLNVTVVEAADRILQRVAAPETSDFFRSLHQSNGVEVLEGTGLAELQGDEQVTQALMTDGQKIDVDFVVVGVGIKPNSEIAREAGLDVNNGICTDAFGKASVQNVWAAGDCASFPYMGTRIRLESVPHAIEHAETVATNILGGNTEYIAKPWFWSDQYDVKLQIAGLNSGFSNVVRRNGAKEGSVSHWYFLADRLLAVDAMNAPSDYMIGKKLIESGKSPCPSQIENPKILLKDLLREIA